MADHDHRHRRIRPTLEVLASQASGSQGCHEVQAAVLAATPTHLVGIDGQLFDIASGRAEAFRVSLAGHLLTTGRQSDPATRVVAQWLDAGPYKVGRNATGDVITRGSESLGSHLVQLGYARVGATPAPYEDQTLIRLRVMGLRSTPRHTKLLIGLPMPAFTLAMRPLENRDYWVDVAAGEVAPEAQPTLQAVMPLRPRLKAHVVTPIPAHLRLFLVGDRLWTNAPDELAGLVGPRTQTLTAVICAAVCESPSGYSAAEMTEALASAGVRAVRLPDIVKAALSFQAKEGHLNRHLEVVQERGADHNDDILRIISVYTKPKAPGAFEAYGGYRDADCPKCFRGEIIPMLIFPASANDFVKRVKGPITLTQAFKDLTQYANEWAFGAAAMPQLHLRVAPQRSGAYGRSAVFR